MSIVSIIIHKLPDVDADKSKIQNILYFDTLTVAVNSILTTGPTVESP